MYFLCRRFYYVSVCEGRGKAHTILYRVFCARRSFGGRFILWRHLIQQRYPFPRPRGAEMRIRKQRKVLLPIKQEAGKLLCRQMPVSCGQSRSIPVKRSLFRKGRELLVSVISQNEAVDNLLLPGAVRKAEYGFRTVVAVEMQTAVPDAHAVPQDPRTDSVQIQSCKFFLTDQPFQVKFPLIPQTRCCAGVRLQPAEVQYLPRRWCGGFWA